MDNLTQAVKQVLDEKGVLSEMKAKIRAEIFESLQIGKQLGVVSTHNSKDDNAKKTKPNTKNKLQWNKEEVLIHEIIKEYMTFHGLQHSLSVFLSETNHKSKNVSLSSELDIERDSNDIHPVIYDILPLKERDD